MTVLANYDINNRGGRL